MCPKRRPRTTRLRLIAFRNAANQAQDSLIYFSLSSYRLRLCVGGSKNLSPNPHQYFNIGNTRSEWWGIGRRRSVVGLIATWFA